MLRTLSLRLGPAPVPEQAPPPLSLAPGEGPAPPCPPLSTAPLGGTVRWIRDKETRTDRGRTKRGYKEEREKRTDERRTDVQSRRAKSIISEVSQTKDTLWAFTPANVFSTQQKLRRAAAGQPDSQ